ncbi:MAG: S41 family peptidase [bacterium]|nr:S41 family peptidase [bacterium]
MKTVKTIFKFLFLGGLWSTSVFIALFIGRDVLAKENFLEDRYASLKLFTDVLSLVEKNYHEKVNLNTLVEGAVRGMLMGLDPHSSYLDPEQLKELKVETKGEFGGLGIEITVKDGFLTVVSPIEDSPAARAGVKPGDRIIKIEDEFARDMTLHEAIQKMRGPKGSPIRISVHRESAKDLIPITIIRDVIHVDSVRSRELGEGFVYLRLAQFQDGTAAETKEAITKIRDTFVNKEIKGLVLDLRSNPGGLLTEAVRVSDLFLADGVIVYTDGRLESQKNKYYAHSEGTFPQFPMVVIIDGGSASASEIVSGALQDASRAVILGTQSFGKGSVQTVIPMDNQGALRLTTALYYTRTGRSIQAKGVTPDVVVKQDEPEVGDVNAEPTTKKSQETRESDLPGAIKNPQTTGQDLRVGSREAMRAELQQLLDSDIQLREALHLLKTWNVFKEKPTVEAKNTKDGSPNQV